MGPWRAPAPATAAAIQGRGQQAAVALSIRPGRDRCTGRTQSLPVESSRHVAEAAQTSRCARTMEEEARHFVGGSALKPEREQIHQDLTDYQAREDALALAAHGCPSEYTEVAKRHMKGQTDLSLRYMLFGSFVSRTRGLHEGIVREIVANNPTPSCH